MLKEQARTFEGLARTADIALIAISFPVSGVICERLNGLDGALAWISGRGGLQDPVSSNEYALLFILSLICWLVVTQWRDTYASARAKPSRSLLVHDLVTQFFWILLLGCFAFFLKLFLISREFTAIFLSVGIFTLNIRTIGSHIVIGFLRTKGFNLRDIVVLGDAKRVAQFSEIIQREATSGYQIVELRPTDVNATADCDATCFDEAFVLMGSNAPSLDAFIQKLVKQGKRVHFVPGFFDAKQFRQSLSEFAGIPILSLGGYGLSPAATIGKRLLDICGSILILIAFSPVMAIVALLVKLSSPGPLLFAQERVGEGGRRFRIYKFRTMYQNAERILQSDPVLYKLYVDNNYKLPKGQDPRITPLGNVLRMTSLDELPQLINVLQGHMSLVGPRPIVPPEIEKYGDYASLFMSVKPGVTGNWQVNGRSDVKDYTERAALDIEYIRDQSLKHDVDILLKTIPVVLLRKGAH